MVNGFEESYEGEKIASVDESVEFPDGSTGSGTLVLYFGGPANGGEPGYCAFTLENTIPKVSYTHFSLRCNGEMENFPLGAGTALTIAGHVTRATANVGPEFRIDALHARPQLVLSPGHSDSP
jgi:hypothetical protein